MGKSDDKKDLRKEVEMNEHTDSIAQVEQQESSFKLVFFDQMVLPSTPRSKYSTGTSKNVCACAIGQARQPVLEAVDRWY